MSNTKVSRLKRLEEALARKTAAKNRADDHAMHQKKIEQYLQHPGHKKPVTRRDFLEVGVYSSMGYLLGPSIATILGSLSESAFGQALECPQPPALGTGPAPFINLHLAGGYQTLSAITPRATDGSRLANYTRLGLGAAPAFVNNVFANGAELFDNGADRGFLRGLQSVAQPSTLANAALVSVPLKDNGDSEQRSSILGLISRAGRVGSKLSYLRRDGEAETGSNGQPAFGVVTTVSPLQVNNTASITGAVVPTGALSRLTLDQQKRLNRAVQSLNSEQAKRVTGLNGGPVLAKLTECATGQNIKNLEGGGSPLDPRQVAGMNLIWNNFTEPNLGGTGDNFNYDAMSAMVLNVLNGNAAGAAMNIGGYDIHNSGTRDDQEIGAFKIGQATGRMLESARLLNSKLFIHLTTNGAVVNAGGQPTDKFNDDDNNGNCFGASHFIAYNPAAAVATTSALPQQIGGLTANGNVDAAVFTSNMDDAGAAIFYNYCMLSGGDALFEQTMAGVKSYSAAQKLIMKKLA